MTTSPGPQMVFPGFRGVGLLDFGDIVLWDFLSRTWGDSGGLWFGVL